MKVYIALFDHDRVELPMPRLELPPGVTVLEWPEIESGSHTACYFGVCLRPDRGRPVVVVDLRPIVWLTRGCTFRLTIGDDAELVRTIAEEVERSLDDKAARGWITKGEPYR